MMSPSSKRILILPKTVPMNPKSSMRKRRSQSGLGNIDLIDFLLTLDGILQSKEREVLKAALNNVFKIILGMENYYIT